MYWCYKWFVIYVFYWKLFGFDVFVYGVGKFDVVYKFMVCVNN